jgi:4-amino-4-deoxy-L-arabinose transferase-like glycosyltransferase
MPAPPAAPPLERRLWQALGICAAIALAALALQVALRLPHRCELEWMEGAMVDHAERVRQGLGLYVPPTAEHVPFLYTPLLFWLGALLAAVLGPGFLPLRLLSIAATVVCALLIARWTRRETGDRRAGFVAAGLFAAGYWYLQTWYDLARNDTLFVGALLATAWLLRWRGRRGAAAAAIPAVLAFLAKQTALMWLPALAVGALLLDWRKGLLFLGATCALLGATVLGQHLATDGWSTFYVFEMPRHHGIEGAYKLKYLTDDLVPLLPMATLALVACVQRWRDGARGEALSLAAFAGGGFVTSWLSRLHVGGFDNVLLPVFAAGCALAPVGARALRSPRARMTGLLLLALQFAVLVVDPRCLWTAHPWLQGGGPRLPTAAQARATDELVAWLRAAPGPVLMPFHGRVSALAGKATSAHAQAIFDLLWALPRNPQSGLPDPTALTDPARLASLSPRTAQALISFYGSMHEGLQAKRFAAVVLDGDLGRVFEEWFGPGLAGNYVRRPGELLSERAALQPPVGMATGVPYALVPVR